MNTMALPPHAPAVTADDVRLGRVARCHAEAVAQYGPVFASSIPIGWPTGPCIVLVGHEALAQATGEARHALSSELGWAPLLGTRFGIALLNADEPQHAQDRRDWSGLFA